MQVDQCRSSSIKHWKVVGTLHNPKGIVRNGKKPNGLENAVFFFSHLQYRLRGQW